ncbi:MAG: bifunctional homocysteine S-methyltransferase/methylenetetrahydrofolate reductase [Ruminococcus sp.]|nr:bifunctional homocysteine S-methyltransferase/methylenetetrahydrofolate reductase [Ruminococcus sp.]
MNIRQYLKFNKIIADGSFGTYYADKYKTNDIPELANLMHPERVEEIHLSYIESGAVLIRTNTFASNTVMLNDNLDSIMKNICLAIGLAKNAVNKSGKDIFIAGDIGSIPNDGTIDNETIEEEYYQLAKTFTEQNVNILTFETFSDTERILPAIRRIKSESDVFVIVQFSVNQFGYSNSGQSASRLIRDAAGVKEIDAVGFNCGVGPAHMQKILENINLNNGKFIVALPNSGYPKRIRNRICFTDNADYFALKVSEIAASGVDIIGGCCGTNPSFIQKLSDMAELKQSEKILSNEVSHKEEKIIKKSGFIYNEDGTLKNKKLIAVELAPPANADDEKILQAAHFLAQHNVDVLTFPDSPSGRTRTDSVLMAQKVKYSTGLDVMPHICCRDKNAIAMRSIFLGSHINDINNMLIITGDPIPTMARATVKSVFNFDSVGLMKIASDMNEEVFTDKPLCYGGAINQGRKRIELEIKRVNKKIAAGAEFFLTQPAFTKEDADRIRIIKEETGARILCGIMPLISRKNALFMKNEITGINVTDEIVSRYSENATKEEGEAVGIAIAREIMDYTKDFVDGYYFSFPFNRVYLLKEILG